MKEKNTENLHGLTLGLRPPESQERTFLLNNDYKEFFLAIFL